MTTVNLTILSGGIASNVVPSEFNATFDIRISPKMDINDFKKLFESWIVEAEGDDADSGRVVCEFLPNVTNSHFNNKHNIFESKLS